MDRRKFITAMSAVPMVAVPMARPEKEIVRYKDAEQDVWIENIEGEDVEFSSMYSFETDWVKCRAYWRSHETPRVVYALGTALTAEYIADQPDIPLSDVIKTSDKYDTIKIAMANTIRNIQGYGPPIIKEGGVLCAPMKPEGCRIVFI